MAVKDKNGLKTITENRKARHEYYVLESLEAGIELSGTEVKSIRAGNVNLKDCYCRVIDGEMLLLGMHISPYEHGNVFNRDPLRGKKLLLHKSEIRKLDSQVMRQGYTLIPLELYLKDGRVKMLLGICRGKQLHDKRDAMAKRDSDMEIRRALRDKQK